MDLTKWDAELEEAETDKYQLYEQINQLVISSPNDVKYLWRRSRAAIILSELAKNNKNYLLEKSLVFEALDDSKKAIESDPNCFEAQMFYCGSVGLMTDFVGVRERIYYGNEFKKHSQIAMSINPNSHALNHMFGRFCYEVSDLKWYEKKIAITFYGVIPESSYEEALTALLKANQLRPQWICNILWISKTLIALKRYNEAINWIDRALILEFCKEDDLLCRHELIELQQKYTKYRN